MKTRDTGVSLLTLSAAIALFTAVFIATVLALNAGCATPPARSPANGQKNDPQIFQPRGPIAFPTPQP